MKICDISPCDALLKALGDFIKGSPEQECFVIIPGPQFPEVEVPIDYCPFCGTNLGDICRTSLEKFLAPRKRRRLKMPAA